MPLRRGTPVAATLSQQYSLAYDTAFIARVTMAMVAYAYTVEQELGSVTNHAARLTLANKVVESPSVYAPMFAGLIASVDAAVGTAYVSTVPSAQANVLDSTIASDVSIAWNVVAGV